MRILPASQADLPAIRAAYADARAIQQAQGGEVWLEFPDAAILGEIDAGHLFRVLDGDALAGVFTVAYEDPLIWGEQERGAHIYLHRLGREGLRIDTWASNAALIAYYERAGFTLVGRRRTPATRASQCTITRQSWRCSRRLAAPESAAPTLRAITLKAWLASHPRDAVTDASTVGAWDDQLCCRARAGDGAGGDTPELASFAQYIR